MRAAEAGERSEAGTTLIGSLSAVVARAIAGDFSQRVESGSKYDDPRAVAKGVNDLVGTVDAGITVADGRRDRAACLPRWPGWT